MEEDPLFGPNRETLFGPIKGCHMGETHPINTSHLPNEFIFFSPCGTTSLVQTGDPLPFSMATSSFSILLGSHLPNNKTVDLL